MSTLGSGRMSDNFFKVDLLPTPFREDLDLRLFHCRDGELERITVFNNAVDFLKLMNDETRLTLTSAGLFLSHSLIFHHSPKFVEQPPHIDASGKAFTFSLNWVFCDGECTYNWFVPKEGTQPFTGQNGVGLNYVKFSRGDVLLVESTTEKGPLVMNTQAIHSGENHSNSQRMSVCLRFNNRFRSMKELKEFMVSKDLCK